MYSYSFGGKTGKKNNLLESNNRIVVRTRNARTLEDAVTTGEGKEVLKEFKAEMEFPEADVTVLKTRKDIPADTVELRDNARAILRNEPELRFAGRVLIDSQSNAPVLYSENIFVKFSDRLRTDQCEKILAEFNLTVKQRPDYAINAFFAGAPENTGVKVFEIAEALISRDEVELCHPELIRQKSHKVIHDKQWHLKTTIYNGQQISASVNAEQAHQFTQGENTVIAVIDDGVDIDHPEFKIPGKVVFSRDVALGISNPCPGSGDNHGTACAGVATASGVVASGVAPNARLMPIRCNANLGSIAESNAFKWAADNGADIISCSWGPADGNWSVPNDPAHFSLVELPDSTRLAIDYAVEKGRNGKGCVVVFAAGNGNEDVMFDGYASYQKVIAVAACNDSSRRSVYSDFGTSVWCSFPSSDFGFAPYNHPAFKTTGIYTVDWMNAEGYFMGNYIEKFGGTSSACPGVAGTIALLLSVNPNLTWQQVRDILKDTSEKIDLQNGQYDAQGHSVFYGYGRVDAEKAVNRANELFMLPEANSVKIISALVNPAGTDKGKENITILNTSVENRILTGWYFESKGKKYMLSGILAAGEAKTITLISSALKLPNNGTTLNLYNSKSELEHSVSYQKNQVKSGKIVEF